MLLERILQDPPSAFHFLEILHFVKVQSAFVNIFRKDRNFLTKFGKPIPGLNRNILTLLHLEFKIPAHAQIAFIYYYLLFTNFLTLYEFKTITLRILFDKWNWSMILLTWSHDFFKNAFWSANFALSFCQIYHAQMSTSWVV